MKGSGRELVVLQASGSGLPRLRDLLPRFCWQLLPVDSAAQLRTICRQCRRRRKQGLIPGLGSCPRGGNGSPPQDPCLENLMDRGARRSAVPRVAESATTETAEHTRTHVTLTTPASPHTRTHTQIHIHTAHSPLCKHTCTLTQPRMYTYIQPHSHKHIPFAPLPDC